MFDRSTIMKAAWEKWIAYYRVRPHLPRCLKYMPLRINIDPRCGAVEAELTFLAG
jgi:hypothetical protein